MQLLTMLHHLQFGTLAEWAAVMVAISGSFKKDRGV
jgi:hypothetical protein